MLKKRKARLEKNISVRELKDSYLHNDKVKFICLEVGEVRILKYAWNMYRGKCNMAINKVL